MTKNLFQLNAKSAHWYRQENGIIVPWYEMPCKGDPTKMRSPDIRDARKVQGAMVSVSSVLKIHAKEKLEDWKIENALMSAMTITRLFGESDKKYVQRVLSDMDSISKKARETGTAVHDVVEQYLMAKKKGIGHAVAVRKSLSSLYPNLDHPHAELAAPCLDWIDKNVEAIHGVEAIVGNPKWGYAGRLDLDCDLRGIGRAVVDFKTQNIRKDKPTFYWDWGVQLGAYGNTSHLTSLFMDSKVALVSVVINTAASGPVHDKRWEDPHKRWMLFRHLLEIWKDEHNWVTPEMP